MKLQQLIEITRQELDDATAPYLWTDSFLLEAAVDAENEAARRGRLIVDSTTTAICQIDVVAGTALYPLDPRVIQVNRMSFVDEAMPVTPMMVRQLDACLPGWLTEESDPPIYWCPDYQQGQILLVGIPTSDATLKLSVERLPLVEMDQMEDEPELRPEYHRNLRHWMMYRAYSLRDSETFNLEQAALAKQMFEAEFGPARPAYDEQWIAHHYNDSMVGRY
ncbi:MAG: DUF6682 family protein [Paracoccaceae bacterium]